MPIVLPRACAVRPIFLCRRAQAELYALDILADLNHGVVGWVDWNLLLDTQGGPNHINRTDIGAPILVASDGSLILQPSYFTLGHITRFVRPGAVRVGSNGSVVATAAADIDALSQYVIASAAAADGSRAPPAPPSSGRVVMAGAFMSVDGTSTSAVIMNAGPVELTVKVRDTSPTGAVRAVAMTLPANSIRTLVYANTA